ncbi:hypothetical protein [Pseudonocardia sp. GCM10023141]|uniref:hypothetical protein n=1 Tax=Pseudonocardia sp. GCM10023141 TaxID=3252653 RepID=UPI003615055E
MWHDRQVQSTTITLDLAGTQDVAIADHQPRTDCAAVTVRIGTALVYIHDMATTETFTNAFFDLAHSARRLPREIYPNIVAPILGMPEPGVIINASGSPIAAGRLIERPGRYSVLRLQVGRLVFNLHDLGAYSSTTAAFRAAASLAPRTFPNAPETFRRTAVALATSAMPTVVSRRRLAQSTQEARLEATASQRVPAASRPRIERT